MTHDDSNDPLQQELRSLTPRPISSRLIPGMHARLARRTNIIRLATAAFITSAAACIALYIALHHPTDLSTPPVQNFAEPSTPLPTVANFRRALASSPDAFNAILRQAPTPPNASQPDPRINYLEQTLAKY